ICMKTSLLERTPGAGRHANFSSGVASASASNWLDTWRHSPSYPCQIPSGAVCAGKGHALNNRRNAKSASLMVCPVSGSLVLGRQNSGNTFYTRERMEPKEELAAWHGLRRERLISAIWGGSGERGGLGPPIGRGRQTERHR